MTSSLREELSARRRERAKLEEAAELDIADWAEGHFLVARNEGGRERGELIQLQPHQRAILRYVFRPDAQGRNKYSTVLYSTPKKSGKTTIAGLVGRWVAETRGYFQEIYCVANDFDQAKNRAFASISRSVELHPEYNISRRTLPGQWRVMDREMQHQVSGSKIKALATDYKGEAGSEPTLTIWTELWGYIHEQSLRFWVEMTPTPTRPLSMRWVETYAGFEGESELLEEIYRLGLAGRQLTAGELGDLSAFAEAPNHDSLVPCWSNDEAGLFMYWDEGELSRRMPWQKGEVAEAYYREQAGQLPPNQFERIHFNRWTSSESEAIPLQWWDACDDPRTLKAGSQHPVVLAADASVSGDCTALVAVARHPEQKDHVQEIGTWIWYPPPGGKMDYRSTLTLQVDQLLADYNVVQVAYDEYQLHHWATEQRDKHHSAWYRPFPQGKDRLVADKQLYDLVRDRKLHHSGNVELRRHVQGAAAKTPKDEENKLRFIKKAGSSKIDGLVCLSMAAEECLRLNL